MSAIYIYNWEQKITSRYKKISIWKKCEFMNFPYFTISFSFD